ncbi:MAG: CopG family transcriptional regulator [Alphaproteobacteria bacterium]|nr:CopG family transcriptional regulator [Alphaproteobacteria bacterium]MBO7097064.1 CopG family transcriptional regulator [Alphaproteobacteria bacterium]
MKKQIATLGILIENFDKIPQVNTLLHDFSDCIVSRLGLPYEKRNIRLINVVMDANSEDVEHLAENLNAISGVTAQAMFF